MRAGDIASACLALALVLSGSVVAVAKPISPSAPGVALSQDPFETIWCYDEDRALVARKTAWKCTGQIIGDAQAQEIQDLRVRRIQGLLKGRKPVFEGVRLRGTGSGFFITETGTVLTNWHVIDKCQRISVTPAGGKAIEADLLGSEQAKDLAVLRTSYRPPAVATFRALRKVSPAEDVIVVGYPLHGKVAIRPILVSGQVIADTRVPRPGRFPMKIDVRRGNSGGPVLDRTGQIVGVVVAKVNTLNVYAATGRLIRNVGIAIRLSVALDFLDRHDIAVREIARAHPLTDTQLFAKAHQFVGQVGCWR
jgi:S1-C subfamily serine protease